MSLSSLFGDVKRVHIFAIDSFVLYINDFLIFQSSNCNLSFLNDCHRSFNGPPHQFLPWLSMMFQWCSFNFSMGWFSSLFQWCSLIFNVFSMVFIKFCKVPIDFMMVFIQGVYQCFHGLHGCSLIAPWFR